MKQLLHLLPAVYRNQIDVDRLLRLEEIRLRAGQPVILKLAEEEQMLWPRVQTEQIEECLQSACRYSIYAHTDTIRQGYITIEGGHRIGICGFGVSEASGTKTIKQPSSLLLRCAREIRGCADPVVDLLRGSALIIGPPCSGKTTILRDLVRQLSDQKMQNVGLADERGELSASYGGIPQLHVGIRTDILLNIPKATAAMMLLRTMNPSWIAMDEITAREDVSALDHIAFSGVKILATAHANNLEELYHRPGFREMLQSGLFANVIEMRKDKQCFVREVPV